MPRPKGSRRSRGGASTYRDSVLEEMDLPAIIRRAPELALIDELAHTNAPGLEHAKRYEDVEDVLAAGIDVFSTVNVQHLESLNDQVAELTGIRVRETVPDAVIGEADEVVLIDITPQSLIERLVAGKVYPKERVPAALNNFFKVENLAALREVALRQVAEEVESKRIPADSARPPRRRAARRHLRPRCRRRAAHGAGQAPSTIPARCPPGLALGPAPRGRARRAVGLRPRPER